MLFVSDKGYLNLLSTLPFTPIAAKTQRECVPINFLSIGTGMRAYGFFIVAARATVIFHYFNEFGFFVIIFHISKITNYRGTVTVIVDPTLY